MRLVRLERPGREAPFVLDQQCRGAVPRRGPGKRHDRGFHFAEADRLNALAKRQQLAPFPHPRRAFGDIVAGQRPPCRVHVVAREQWLSGARQIVDFAGVIAFARERTFEMGRSHQQAASSWFSRSTWMVE
jgi:hypothetical protein